MQITSQTKYFTALDSLRFVAVTLVLVEHWLHNYDFVHLLPFGDLGVDLFFVLSGFLITGILLRYREKDLNLGRGHGHSLKTFFMRRVLRIFPIYWAVVIVTALANKGLIQEALPWNMSYLTNYFIMDHGDWPGNFGHFWSLAVEEQFYLLWPFVILFIPGKHLVKIFVGFLSIAVLYRYFIFDATNNYVVTIVGTPGCFDAFALGGLLAWLGKNHLERIKSFLVGWWFPLLVVAIYTGLRILSIQYQMEIIAPVFYRLMHALFAFWLIGRLAYTSLGGFQKVAEFRAFVFIGQISYGMYLLHNFIPGFLMGIPLPESAFLRFPIYFAALVLAAWIAKWIIERPFNKLKTRFVA